MADSHEGPICSNCGFTNLAIARFCGGCGTRLTVGPSPVVWQGGIEDSSPDHCPVDAASQAQSRCPSSLANVVSSPRRAGATTRPTIDESDASLACSGIPLSALKKAVSDKAVHLLIFGLIATGLAQLGLYFSVELNARAPTGYLLLLALGIAAFTLGSAGLRMRRSNYATDTDSLALKNMPSPSWTSLRSPLGIAGLAIGVLALAFLVSTLAAGSESGSAVTVWVVVLVAFALPFVPLAEAANWQVNTRTQAWLRRFGWDLLIVVGLLFAFIAVNLYDLRDWYYSAIGDEYLFYEHTKRIVDEGIARPFSQEGVYNRHPVLNSVFQAGVMRMFGADYFGWKFSETLNVALTIPAIYLLGHQLGGRRAAIVATVMFAFSHYVFAFAHTGYNNLSPLPVAAWAVALCVMGWRRQSLVLLYAAGLIAGLGFYTHYSARAILPILVLFSLSMGGPKRLAQLWPLGLGFALTVVPTFVVEQEGVLTRMFGQVVGGYTEVVTGSVVQRVLDNIVLNLPAFSYNATVHTYVYGALLDPVSGLLAALGIAYALGNLRDHGCRLLLVWFAVAMFMTGILSPYPHVAVTRLIFAVLPLTLLAGLMAGRFWALIPPERLKIPERLRSAVGISIYATVLPVILALNLWQFWHVTPSVFPHSPEAVALGAFRSEACGADLQETLFVGNAVGEGSLLQRMMSSMHPQGPALAGISHSELTEGTELPEPSPGCIVFLNPDAAEARRLQNELTRRYPDGRLLPFTNPSDTTTVAVFTR